MQLKKLLPGTGERVPRHTATAINKQIHQKIKASVRRCSTGGSGAIDRRIEALDREWDIERALEANASVLAYLGVMMGFRDRRWLILPAAVTAFLFQHALQGWCPPVPVLRRLGFRTQGEIEYERYALKALRGDFAGIAGKKNGRKVDQALRAAKNRPVE